jgi:hypothetical protein
MKILLLALVLAFALPLLGGETVRVTISGSVEENQIDDPPLGNADVGEEATLTLFLDSDDFVTSGTFPVRGYVIDEPSCTLTIGTTTVGLADPFPASETPYFVVRNDDPAVDGFFVGSDIDGFADGIPLDQEGVFGAFRANYSVSYDNDPLPTLDILDALGSYDFTGLTSFNFSVDDGPFNPMLILFETLTIELFDPPTPPAVPDGSDGPPLRVQKVPNNPQSLRLLFDTTTCVGDVSHHLIHGFRSDLPAVAGGTFAVDGSVCAIGGSPFTWSGVPDPSLDPSNLLWFLMLTGDGGTTEGSWGSDSTGAERVGPGAGGASLACGMTEKDLQNSCGQ